MSLIPYHPREGREIVLRHRNAIVVRDPSSQRLEIRGLSECPTCRQPLRSSSPDRQFDSARHHDSFVDPNYFRMLRAGHHSVRAEHPPSSPIRRFVQPILATPQPAVFEDTQDVEFISSTPAVQEGSRIRREAFSPNYFKTFFVEEKELGRGGKGVVLLVRHEIDGCHLGHFACKRVPVGDDHAWLEKVLIEVELLAKLSHPNLVSYRHVWLEDVTLTRFGPSVACAFILQQYCNGGDLLQYIIGEQPKETTKEQLKAQMRRKSKGQLEIPRDQFASQRLLSFEEIFSLFKDITSGLAYLHAANYIHRDLKPSNCLLHREGSGMICLISDFGEVQSEHMVRKSTGSTGTISYCAPEVLRRDSVGRYGNFTTKSDIFSLGMILYFMCFGRLPYRSANTINEELEDIDALRAEITDWQGFQDERRERPDLPSKLYQLLKRLVALDPSQRPSANEVLAAMKTESTVDSVPRGRSSSPPVGLHNRRIQNLDSPVPPSTPVPDPQKQSRFSSSQEGYNIPSRAAENSSPRPSLQTGMQRLSDPSSPRHRPQAQTMVASRSQDSFPRLSPEIAVSEASAESVKDEPLGSPPLLMPPPPGTRFAAFQHRLMVGWLRAGHLIHHNASPLLVVTRLGLFLSKLYSLTRPCWPYMVDTSVGAFLVVIAALDLGLANTDTSRELRYRQDFRIHNGLPWAWGLRGTVLLAVIHLVVLWAAGQWNALCTTGGSRSWSVHDDNLLP
ncbi:putative serine/threonine-protein kinase iksA [Colletotrichum fructicola]|uniref:non-specific serine/threonine protein kinase n=1 Tax=Colletotrichum fructicola (strain Nara gc5) TaxID=1213859 RepID=L2FV70_COLFN|nr:putative serine/threonine-protein kinase iksA [Colletotrichum fructicola]KAF4898596.1 putative serine/threonine-protein kinase iksA [Colletotrichum fructicola]KAF4941616.1 putative serine/threonine-protein kinase iksA [Colletotrichum fructicola]